MSSASQARIILVVLCLVLAWGGLDAQVSFDRLMNAVVSLQKDVALVSLIGPVEILRQAGIDKAKFANFTPYVAAAVIFLALTIPCTRLADWALARQRKRTGVPAIA